MNAQPYKYKLTAHGKQLCPKKTYGQNRTYLKTWNFKMGTYRARFGHGGFLGCFKSRNFRHLKALTYWKLGLFNLVAGAGFEPTTFGLWARRATRLLHPAICNFYCYTIISHLLNKSSKIYGGGGEIRTPARSHVCWFSRPVPSATWVLLHKEILFYLVDPVGLEPTTNRLWAGSSNQLS